MNLSFSPVSPQNWRDYWKQQSDIQDSSDFSELLQKYFNPDMFFCSGPYFLWVMGFGQKPLLKYIGGQFERITGYPRELFIGKDLPSIHELLISRYDSQVLLGFAQVCQQYLAQIEPHKRNKIKFSFHVNITHKNGHQVPLLQQDAIYTNEEGILKYGFSIISDISHLKVKNDLMMTILNTETNDNQTFISITPDNPSQLIQTQTQLSIRERQVLGLLAEGMSSKQIALKLDIAFNTVNVHRQNMLAKTGCKSSSELVKYAMEKGLI